MSASYWLNDVGTSIGTVTLAGPAYMKKSRLNGKSMVCSITVNTTLCSPSTMDFVHEDERGHTFLSGVEGTEIQTEGSCAGFVLEG